MYYVINAYPTSRGTLLASLGIQNWNFRRPCGVGGPSVATTSNYRTSPNILIRSSSLRPMRVLVGEMATIRPNEKAWRIYNQRKQNKRKSHSSLSSQPLRSFFGTGLPFAHLFLSFSLALTAIPFRSFRSSTSSWFISHQAAALPAP